MAKTMLLVAMTMAVMGCAVEETEVVTENDWAALESRPSFDLYTDAGGQFRFNLMTPTADVLVSSQGYVTRLGALGGLLSVLDNGGDRALYDVKTAVDGSVYFNLMAANRNVIATSETYATAAEAEADVARTIATVGQYVQAWESAAGARYSVKLDAGGQWYFGLYAKNGALVLRSERYLTEAAALNGAFSVADNGATAARYQIKATASGKYYFVLTATNGQVIGTSEMYSSKYNAERGRDAVMALVPQVPLL